MWVWVWPLCSWVCGLMSFPTPRRMRIFGLLLALSPATAAPALSPSTAAPASESSAVVRIEVAAVAPNYLIRNSYIGRHPRYDVSMCETCVCVVLLLPDLCSVIPRV